MRIHTRRLARRQPARCCSSVLLVLLCFAASVAVAAASHQLPADPNPPRSAVDIPHLRTDVDVLPSGLRDEQVVLITLALALSAALSAAAATRWLRSRIRLATLLGVAMWTALVAVALGVWLVTYTRARDVIHRNEEAQLGKVLVNGAHAVAEELAVGTRMVELAQALAEDDRLPHADLYPRAHVFLGHLLRASTATSHSVSLVYIGTADGRFHGVGPVLGAPRDVKVLHIGMLPGDPLPPWVRCDAVDHAPVSACAPHVAAGACGNASALDRSCIRSCGARDQSPAHCYGSVDGPPHLVAQRCLLRERSRTILPLPAGDDHAVPPLQTVYDPRRRPWYTNASEPAWSNPYLFVTDEQEIGVTVSIGLYGRGGSFIGSAGIDFRLESLDLVMRQITTTPRALSAIFARGGVLLATSLNPTELAADAGPEYTLDMLRPAYTYQRRSKIRRLYHAVHSPADGAPPLEVCLRLPAEELPLSFDMDGGDIVMSCPIRLEGSTCMLLALAIPYADVMGASEEASTVALALALSISVAIAAVVFAGVGRAMKPLHSLSDDMGQVAAMRLGNVASRICGPDARSTSRVHELWHMQTAFAQMVEHLLEIQHYLPQYVLRDSETSSDCDVDAVDAADCAEECAAAAAAAATAAPAAADPVSLRRASFRPQGGCFDAADETSSLSNVSSATLSPGSPALAVDGGGGAVGAGVTSDPDEAPVRSSGSGSTPRSGTVGAKNGLLLWQGLMRSREKMLSTDLKLRGVTLAVLNVRRFHAISRTLKGASFRAVLKAYLEPIVAAVKPCKGIVDDFYGDHVSLSFNGSLVTTAHRLKAVTCCIKLMEDFTHTPVPELKALQGAERLRVNVALASGKALCGNAGCDGLKKFVVIGRVATVVRRIERWGARWGLRVICNESVAEDVACYVHGKQIAQVVAGSTAAATTLYELRGMVASLDNGEWMYQMASVEGGSPYGHHNAALACLYRGEYDTALRELDLQQAAAGENAPPLPATASFAQLATLRTGTSASYVLSKQPLDLRSWVLSCQRDQTVPSPLPLFDVPHPQHDAKHVQLADAFATAEAPPEAIRSPLTPVSPP
eukprot:Rhum_TRINITY_DN18973_c0_g1::Rhum_TRINITY_DN18973_c0_g1_i1::g.168928::m.168928